LVSYSDNDRFDLGYVGAETLNKSSNRRHHNPRSSFRITEMPQRAEPTTHGLHGRAHSLKGKGLPRREEIDLIRAKIGGKIAGQSLSLTCCRHRDHDRLAISPMGQTSNDDRPGRLRNDKDRIASTQHRGKTRFIDEELGEIGERHWFFQRDRNRPGA
jgi:hypothetical protein